MAIVKSMWMQGTSKKLGGSVLYQAMGQTRQRELAASVANPRTQSQMNQRTRWANLVNFYRVNAGWMKFAYETKATNQSEYNKFMSLNVSSSRIYLPKSIANQGGCIVDAYQMTQGSLASVEVTKVSSAWRTNIYLQSATNLDTNSTIGEWTQQLLPANPALREGDQISFIRFTQQTNSSTGVPFVIVRKYEVILNSADTRRFYDFMPEDYIVPGGSAQVPCLQVDDSGNAGGFLLIISRTIGGKTYVSSQSIVVANNETLISEYSSAAAKQAAIDSYGESAEPFLTSSVAEMDSQAAVRPSIIGVKIGGVNYPLGSIGVVQTISSGDAVEITFSQGNLASAVDDAQLAFYSGGLERTATIENCVVSNNKITGELSIASDFDNCYLEDLTLENSDGDFRAVWFIPNEATIQGLE